MVRKQSGVILTITATPARLAIPLVGGMAAAWAAVESLSRDLSAELGQHGIRVVCLRSNAIPETSQIREVFGIHAKTAGMSWEQFETQIKNATHGSRLPTLADVANVAAFMASDKAGLITGTVINLRGGSIVD